MVMLKENGRESQYSTSRGLGITFLGVDECLEGDSEGGEAWSASLLTSWVDFFTLPVTSVVWVFLLGT